MTKAAKTQTLERIRALCLSFPETSERPSHGAPAFFIRDKKSFVMLWDDHHGDGRLAIWCAAPPGALEALVASDSDAFFRPPYVAHLGWVGVRLEKPDWNAVAEIIEDAYRKAAPAKLVAILDAR